MSESEPKYTRPGDGHLCTDYELCPACAMCDGCCNCTPDDVVEALAELRRLFPVVPAGQIEAEVAADWHRLTHPEKP